MICIAGDYYIMKQYYSIVGDEKYGRWGLLDCYLFFLDIYIYQSVFYGLFMARRGKINQHFTAIKHGWLENPRTK
jgi:hypothetical protein